MKKRCTLCSIADDEIFSRDYAKMVVVGFGLISHSSSFYDKNHYNCPFSSDLHPNYHHRHHFKHLLLGHNYEQDLYLKSMKFPV